MIAELALGETVSLPGFTTHMPEKIKNASMFVLASNYEGIPNVVIEAMAMAMGMPVIATDCPVGGVRMLIRNNENGILIGVNDGDALLKAMNRLAGDKNLDAKLRKNAMKIRSRYSIQ